eukprot:3992300-Heterocapsa_arctica.AAC.1
MLTHCPLASELPNAVDVAALHGARPRRDPWRSLWREQRGEVLGVGAQRPATPPAPRPATPDRLLLTGR